MSAKNQGGIVFKTGHNFVIQETLNLNIILTSGIIGQ